MFWLRCDWGSVSVLKQRTQSSAWPKPAIIIILPSKPANARLKSFEAVGMHSRMQPALRDPASDGRHSMFHTVALLHRIRGCLSCRLAVRALKENQYVEIATCAIKFKLPSTALLIDLYSSLSTIQHHVYCATVLLS